MPSAFLCTGKTEDLIALGDTGQPVHKAAMQIIAALTRKSPELAKFLAVPKSNEQGDTIDWYSPVPGEVIPWASATETERNDARQKLDSFKVSIKSISEGLITSSDKNKQSDTMVFGKLLGLASYCPDDTHVNIVKSQKVNAGGANEPYSQPVLSFWGFINNEDDRKRNPLYFLAPLSTASIEPALAATPVISTVPKSEPSITTPTEKKPWWLFWSGWRFGFGWLWPLLLILLLLLLLSLLRGCIPSISLPHFGLPSFGSHEVGAPSLPALQSSEPSSLAIGSDTHKTETVTTMPEPVQVQAEPTLQSADKHSEASPTPAATPAPQPALSNTPQTEQPAEPVSVQNPSTPQTNLMAAPKMDIPPEAAEGPAEFLNGQYRAGAGIQDRRTGKPLRLEYAFKGGKGNVTVRRPDGIACTGGVNATMSNGSLAIISQGQAACSDGSQYDMPQVNCKPGAQSIADCTGQYGNETFPMSMVKEDK